MCDCKVFYGIDNKHFSERSCTYTSEEIARQPRLWKELARILTDRKDDIKGFMDEMHGIGRMRIIFTGAGSSAFIGDALSAMVSKSFGIRTESIHTTDIVSAPESYLFADEPTLLVSFARSGNSPESVGAVKYARSVIRNLYEVAIVCDCTSNLFKLAELSDKRLILVMPEESNDNGFAMTSSVTCMLLAGFALFDIDNIESIAKDIDRLSKNTSNDSLKFTETAKRWAEKDFTRVAYLGSGFMKHIAHEASLKMMELTNGTVNGTYESATGFRHGPKSVIHDKTVTVHMISNDPFTAKYDVDLVKEVAGQQKGNKIIAICTESAGDLPGDEIITIPSGDYGVGGDICTGIQSLVFCQMLAMFKSLWLGIPTDNPSPTGEVNRVVKGVVVYEY
jgi:tagatose-6-phosphate ketose/aldose isomerase